MIKLIPGKSNLEQLGYSLYPDDKTTWWSPSKEGKAGIKQEEGNGRARGWKSMDDTSAWIVTPKDKKIVGQLDWSEGPGGFYAPGCSIGGLDIYLDRIDVWDKGKGYGTKALKQKHEDWGKRGFDSVTLRPVSRETAQSRGSQEGLYKWYQGHGYRKSTKCEHPPTCADNFNCYLTKELLD